MSDQHVRVRRPPYATVPEALLYDPAISDKAVRLYGVLIRHGDDPENCYPSQARLAKLIGCAQRSVQRPLVELEEAGWIERRVRFDPNRARTSDGFTVHYTPCTSSAPPAQESAVPPARQMPTPHAPARGEREPLNERTTTASPTGAAAPSVPSLPFSGSETREVGTATAADKGAKPRAKRETVTSETARELVKAELDRRRAAGLAAPVAPFPALAMRVQEALDAGNAEARVRAALPRVRSWTRGGFDMALTEGTPPARAGINPAPLRQRLGAS